MFKEGVAATLTGLEGNEDNTSLSEGEFVKVVSQCSADSFTCGGVTGLK